MKRLIVCFGVVFGLLLMPILGQAATYKWKFAHEEMEGGLMDIVAKEFAKRLATKSGGAIQIDIYPTGTLGTSEDMLELLQKNVIQFNWSDIGHVGSQIPEAQALLLHYLFPKDKAVVQEVLTNGTFQTVLNPFYEACNIKPLGYFSEGWQVWTSNHPLRTPDDFKGFKIRTMTSKLIVDNYRAYGANPTPTPFSEVYSALQLKIVDGQENPTFMNYDMKFYEVQEYLNYGYCSPFVLTMIMNNDLYKTLPANIQKMITETGKELIPFGFEVEAKLNADNYAAMMKKKPALKRVELNQEQMDVFAIKAHPVRESYFAMTPKNGPVILQALEDDIIAAKKTFNVK